MDERILRKTFKYRCYPNIRTRKRLFNVMWHGVTPVWNACVAEREEARAHYKELLDESFCDWVMDNKRDIPEKAERTIRKELAKQIDWPTAYSQYKHCRKRDNPQYSAFHSKMLECTVAQVDGGEKSFRSLRSNGKDEAKHPKQQRLHRCITFRSSGWKPLRADDINRMDVPAVSLTAIGRIKIRLHRPISGKIKTVSITEKNGRWYALFSCEVTEFPGACGPVSPDKPAPTGRPGQKHTSTGGSDPEKGDAHNQASHTRDPSLGGSDPEKGDAHNILTPVPGPYLGGSDPEKGDAHNICRKTQVFEVGGSDPEKGDAHNSSPKQRLRPPSGSDPEKGARARWRRGKVTLQFAFTDGLFIEDSTGLKINHPEFYFTHIEQLQRLSRALSRKQFECLECGRLSSGAKIIGPRKNPKRICPHCKLDWNKKARKNRRKARRTLARFQEHIRAKRDYFLWHVGRFYAMTYEQVVIPKWPLKVQIEYAVDTEEARKLCDSAYGKFIGMLKYKCQEFGTEIVERKDEQWERKMQEATEVAKREKLSVILRKARTAVRHDYRGLLKYLETACERLTTLRIC